MDRWLGCCHEPYDNAIHEVKRFKVAIEGWAHSGTTVEADLSILVITPAVPAVWIIGK